ncbi:hypothetical protein METP3_02168 [Methanosarcinales archaeon]|nr:hypothetical protein METP3_02168 [Methanosarcinales archaeon]
MKFNESKSIYVLNSYPNNTQINTKLGMDRIGEIAKRRLYLLDSYS